MTTPVEPTTPATGPGTDPAAPPAVEPTPPAPPAVPAGDDTDWKAMARQWEKRAKENSKAAEELEKVRKANLSEQEKAVEAAKSEGRKEADAKYGARLAAATFEAACAKAGVDLGDATEFIDVAKFVGDDGEVNTTAIKSAVTKFSNLAPKGPGRSGADLSGGSGEQTASIEKQIQEATAKRDFTTVVALKRQLAARGT